MDAPEFFETVVKGNWQEFNAKPPDFRLLWNAILSMNTVPEYVALEQLGHADVQRSVLARKANTIRNRELHDLKFCAESLKHVRKIIDSDKRGSQFTTVSTSTGVAPNDQVTWRVGSHDLVTVAGRAFETLNAWPELTAARP
jgi:hypothetical protein